MTSEMRTYSTAPSVMEGKGHRENGLRILGTGELCRGAALGRHPHAGPITGVFVLSRTVMFSCVTWR